jgi:molybdopterin synthase sulfur carrier subunit
VRAEDQVTVRFFAAARSAAGCDQVLLGPGSLDEIIESMHAAFPALSGVTPMCSFLVNSLSVKRLEGAMVIGAGSSVDVLPPFAGG